VRVPARRKDLDPAGPTVSVVIPAINEARNLPWLATRMPDGVKEIILVDGYSTDDTIETAQSLWPEVRIVHQTRRGKGNALACGFAAARGDIIVMIDADGSMDPGEIPYFVDALVDGADYAKGSRFTPGGGSSDITRFRAAGNHVLNVLTGLVHRTSYTDLCYGFNAFWRRILPVLALEAGEGGERQWGDGFEVETLINIRVHSAGLRITEVPSFERQRLHGASNLHAFADGWRVLSIIARESRALQSSQQIRNTGLAQLLERTKPQYSEPRSPATLGADRGQGAAIGLAFAGAGEADNVIDLHAPSELDRRTGELAGAAARA
jgi:glycosyltransferase involved in cell wall biosynthesis